MCLVATTLDSLVLGQWFSRCGTQTSSSSSLWELLEVQIRGPHSKLNESDPLGVWATNMCFNKSLSDNSDIHQGLRTIAVDSYTFK